MKPRNEKYVLWLNLRLKTILGSKRLWCLRSKILSQTWILYILANKRGGESEGRISHEAIKADRKWEGVRTPNFCLDIKADKNRKTNSKKAGNFYYNLSRFTRKSSQIKFNSIYYKSLNYTWYFLNWSLVLHMKLLRINSCIYATKIEYL